MDAHAFLHRAYHALPPLTNSKGEPVGALYGFARMLLQLVKKEKPEGVAVCFDTPGPTFRHGLHKEYKATRKEIDGDLISQLKLSREMAEAMGFRCVELPGFEADDVMATLARRCAKEGKDAVLVTGDKDALQLVGSGIRVFNVSKNIWMDAPQIEEKLGVPPAAVVDYLSLVGDASDNVPGVRGIGPVGAAKLLKQFGSVKGAIKAAKAGDASITPKTAKALVDGEKDALAALELIRLADDIPLAEKVSDCGLPQPEKAKLREVLGRLEFTSLIEEILPGAAEGLTKAAGHGAKDRAPSSVAAQRPVLTIKEVSLEPFLKELSKAKAVTVTAIPSEGGDLLDRSLAYVCFGLPDQRAALVDATALKAHRAALAAILSGPALKVGYHLKETRKALDLLDLPLSGPVFDTMLAAYCLDPKDSVVGLEGEDWKARLSARAGKALGHEALKVGLEGSGVWELFDGMETPLSEVLREMEARGIAIDAGYLRKLSKEFEGDIAVLKAKLDEMAGAPINVNSPKQLGELLFDKLGLPVIHKTAKGGRSTDEEALKVLAALNPIPAKVLDYRELTKLKSTYIDGLLGCMDPAASRVHTHFDQTGTTTGRLSSVDPNLQNIPIRSASGQRIRRAFVASKGCVLLSADYSQIDLRVLAHMSQDAVLMGSFVRNEDIHLRTACEMFKLEPKDVDKELRRRAKAINFGIVYGQTAHGLSVELGIPYKEAADYIKSYLGRYQGVQAWIENNLEAARRDGFVRTFAGRLRHLPDLAAKNAAVRQFAERAARNTPIQGGSADIIKLAMLRVQEGLAAKGAAAKMLLQIHDELVFDVPKGELKSFAPWVRGVMETAVKLSVPLVVDVKAGANWQDMEAAGS